jgi:hypothetical protein
MSDEYIDTHFDEIKEHGSEIEARLDDSFFISFAHDVSICYTT